MSFLSKWRLLHQCAASGMVRSTRKVRRAVVYAYDEALRESSTEVIPEHLLFGLLRADRSLAAHLALDWLRKEIQNAPSESRARTDLFLSEAARRVILLAADERERLGHRHTGTEHLLLGIIRSGTALAKLLEQRGWTIERARDLIRQQHRAIAWEKAEPILASYVFTAET